MPGVWQIICFIIIIIIIRFHCLVHEWQIFIYQYSKVGRGVCYMNIHAIWTKPNFEVIFQRLEVIWGCKRKIRRFLVHKIFMWIDIWKQRVTTHTSRPPHTHTLTDWHMHARILIRTPTTRISLTYTLIHSPHPITPHPPTCSPTDSLTHVRTHHHHHHHHTLIRFACMFI